MNKKILIFIIFIGSINCIYSQTLNELMGVKFGTSGKDIKNIMKHENNATYWKSMSYKDIYTFVNVKYLDFDCYCVSFWCNKQNQFHTGIIYFIYNNENDILKKYYEIKDKINKQYFKTELSFENYIDPYESNDNKTIEGIKKNKIIFSTYWEFKNPNAENDLENNIISLTIDYNLFIVLTYQNGKLVNKPKK